MTTKTATHQSRATYFQDVVERMLIYWREHDALKNMDVAVLDRERNRILKNIALGLDLQPLWPLVKKVVIAFAPYMERRGYWDAWHGILEQAIHMAQRAEDIEAETTLTAFLARLCQRMSRPADVVQHYRRVIRLARQSGNRFEKARACSNLGYLYIDGGHWWRSEVLSHYALTVFTSLESNHGLAHTHNHLGLLYIRQLRHDLAEQHLQCACLFWSKIDDKHGLLRGYLNMGLLYNDSLKPNDAINVLRKALNLSIETGESAEVGSIKNNLGLALIRVSEYEKAKEQLSEAKRISLSQRNPQLLARILQNFGRLYRHQCEWKISQSMLEEALAIIRSTNTKEAELSIHIEFVEYAIASANLALAHTHFRHAHNLVSIHFTVPLQIYYQNQLHDLDNRITNL